MNIIQGSYSRFERNLLAAAYYTSNRMEKSSITLEEIAGNYEIDLDLRWVKTALGHFNEIGWSKEKMHSGTLHEQRIWLTAEGIKEAESLIERDMVRLHRSDTVDSVDWTGQPPNKYLTEEKREKLLDLLREAESRLDEADLGNSERSQTLAYITAVRALAESPEPPADLIWELISRANNISGVAALFVSIIGLFT